MTIDRITRTYLAVPAHRLRLVESAARSGADAVFLDLEDAVPPSMKAEALRAACLAIETLDWGEKTVTVRVNVFGSPTFAAELAALGSLERLDAILLPKAEQTAQVLEVAASLAVLGMTRERPPVEIDLLIETAAGLVNVERLAESDKRVAALHLGVGDFAASIGARSSEIGASPTDYLQTARDHEGVYSTTSLDFFAYPMMRLLVAARAFGLRAIDGPCGVYSDRRLTGAWALKAAAMGFDGKQVIHPTQIQPTLQAFEPSIAQVNHARRIVAAMADAEDAGKGAVALDGKMIDYANLRMAQRVIKLASG